MISITSYAKSKKSSQSSNNGGGGFANTVIKNTNGISPFYLWGQYIDGRDNINGDLISNGTINGNKLVAPQGDIDLIKALSEYVSYISGHTAIFDNLSGDTAHFNQDVFVGGDIDVEGDTNIGGDTVIEGDLSVSGDTHLTNLWTENITNSGIIKTKNLEVSGLAHFFQLVIDRIKAAGGAILLTPADGFETALVEEDASGYTLYFHAKDGEKQISNMWEVNDQAICQTFNASTGTSYNVSNTYYWALVTEVSEQAVEKTVSGVTNEYHYIKLSKSVYDGELNPKVGDEIAMLGSRNENDPQRQSAIYLSAYVSLDQGLTAPCFAEYKGVNDFSLSSHRHSYIDATGASFYGDFRIDNNTTIQDYVNSATTEVRNEFRFDTEGLYSRVSKMTNPNILPANGWTDQDDKALLQEDDEEYIFEEPQQQSMAKGGFSEDVVSEDLIGMPPVIYLNSDTYTFSIYSQVKFEDIHYGYEKDNLNMTLPVQTTFNSGDTWHNQSRAITTFYAPIDGYYHLGAKMMDSGYTGDYEYVDPDEGGSGYTPSESAITTSIEISMTTKIILGSEGNKATATISPSSFSGTVIWNSSDTSVATIDQEGNITAIETGTTTISATIPEQYWNGKHYLGSSDNVSLNVKEELSSKYLAIESVGNNPTITVNKVGSPTGTMSYRKNGTGNWTNITTTTSISTQEGDYLEFKGDISNTSYSNSWRIIASDDVEVSGYLMALNKNTEITSSNNSIGNTKFSCLFSGCTGLVNAEDLILPSDTYQYCYDGLFQDCVNLIEAPTLPSTALTNRCYQYMFEGCTSLTNLPQLPATTLARSCYSGMFKGCSSLTSIPSNYLSATTLATSCYEAMFKGCSNLTNLPQLPATTLAHSCYLAMFEGCSSITSIPSNYLPSTNLALDCYAEMFKGCSNLTNLPQLPATNLHLGLESSDTWPGVYYSMFEGCISITSIPANYLSATILDDNCYSQMFKGCTGLTAIPELPSTNVRFACYYAMFSGCTQITTAELPSTSLAEHCYDSMFRDCSSLSSLTISFSEYDYSSANYDYLTNWMSGIETNGICYCPSLATYSASDIHLPSTWILSKTLWSDSSQTISYSSLPQSGLTVGDSHSLQASSQGGTLSYSSSNPNIATVDSNGIISALTSGQTTITITASAYDDDVNFIQYSSASTSVSVDVSEAVVPSYDPLKDSKYFVVKFTKKINPSEVDNSLRVTKKGSPGSLSYRQNGIWTEIDDTTTINFQNVGEYILFKGNITNTTSNSYYFSTTNAEIEIGGCLMALNKNAEIDNTNNTIGNASFRRMFLSCSGLTSAEYLKMADDCYSNCYYQMFNSCTSLTTAPQLPSTTLATSCYYGMFLGCSNLTKAPLLPATTLANTCYISMFSRCSSLTSLTVGFTSIAGVSNSIRSWLSNVTTDGILYCPSDADYSASDLDLPSTWTLSKTL